MEEREGKGGGGRKVWRKGVSGGEGREGWWSEVTCLTLKKSRDPILRISNPSFLIIIYHAKLGRKKGRRWRVKGEGREGKGRGGRWRVKGRERGGEGGRWE